MTDYAKILGLFTWVIVLTFMAVYQSHSISKLETQIQKMSESIDTGKIVERILTDRISRLEKKVNE